MEHVTEFKKRKDAVAYAIMNATAMARNARGDYGRTPRHRDSHCWRVAFPTRRAAFYIGI
ncbi:MAG: hypothetical protein IPG56_14955 [Caulobacteraceae bacterium]|nr:hypothetical protein [Caulobacteraceae bacterium]